MDTKLTHRLSFRALKPGRAACCAKLTCWSGAVLLSKTRTPSRAFCKALALMGLLPDNARLAGQVLFEGRDLLSMAQWR